MICYSREHVDSVIQHGVESATGADRSRHQRPPQFTVTLSLIHSVPHIPYAFQLQVPGVFCGSSFQSHRRSPSLCSAAGHRESIESTPPSAAGNPHRIISPFTMRHNKLFIWVLLIHINGPLTPSYMALKAPPFPMPKCQRALGLRRSKRFFTWAPRTEAPPPPITNCGVQPDINDERGK